VSLFTHTSRRIAGPAAAARKEAHFMFGSLGLPELLLIFAVALIVFGPKKLPEIGRTLGKALGEFKKATDDLKNTIEREVRLEETKTITTPVIASTPTVSRAEPAAPAIAPSPAPERTDYTQPTES
jgi:TatA/E family protein of Tat protein translocase